MNTRVQSYELSRVTLSSWTDHFIIHPSAHLSLQYAPGLRPLTPPPHEHPIMVNTNRQHAHPLIRQTLVYTLGSAVNGGLVGVAGPSLATISEETGLGNAALGRVVLMNRLTKLLGTFVWTAYARRLQKGRGVPVQPRMILACCATLISACAICIAKLRRSSLVLHIALAIAGLCYGVADSAMTLLTVWAFRTPTQQRFHVAMLNVGFTLGALLTPTIVAVALRVGSSCYVGFYALAGLALLATPFLLTSKAPPKAPPAMLEPTASDGGASGHQRGVEASRAGERPNARAGAAMIACMCAVLFCVTGAEHGLATWLPTYGHRVGNIDPAEMAFMSTGYWAMIAAGRIIWAAISGAISSGFPALAFDGVLMLIAAALVADFDAARATTPLPGSSLLWGGTLALGFGCSSSLPCAITLPSEAHVELTPVRMLLLNLAMSAGEMVMPFVIGLAFERAHYHALGTSLVLLETAVTASTAIAWRIASAARRRHAGTDDEIELRERLVAASTEDS